VRTAYKVRAYPDPEQAAMLNRTFGCVRVVWNKTLAWRHARYFHGELPTSILQANAYLTMIKATEDLAWLNEVSSVPLQQAIRHQQVAFTNFFAERARHPRFKSRNGRQSAEYTRSGFRYRDGMLFLAKIDVPLRFAWSWPDIDPATINPTTVTVSKDPCGRRLARRERNLARYQRDINAAKNILAAGRAVGAGNGADACGADVRPQGTALRQSATKQETMGVSPGSPSFRAGSSQPALSSTCCLNDASCSSQCA
jgi:putative transposase